MSFEPSSSTQAADRPPNQSVVLRDFDPLKIYYIVVLQTDSQQESTPFQGFSTSWQMLRWSLRLLVTLPADVLERSQKIGDVIAHRMGGLRQLSWLPLNVNALERVNADQLGLFIVCFSGENESARRVELWVRSQPFPILHVSSVKVAGACYVADFDVERLH